MVITTVETGVTSLKIQIGVESVLLMSSGVNLVDVLIKIEYATVWRTVLMVVTNLVVSLINVRHVLQISSGVQLGDVLIGLGYATVKTLVWMGVMSLVARNCVHNVMK